MEGNGMKMTMRIDGMQRKIQNWEWKELEEVMPQNYFHAFNTNN